MVRCRMKTRAIDLAVLARSEGERRRSIEKLAGKVLHVASLGCGHSQGSAERRRDNQVQLRACNCNVRAGTDRTVMLRLRFSVDMDVSRFDRKDDCQRHRATEHEDVEGAPVLGEAEHLNCC
jgi:hypothetical protein